MQKANNFEINLPARMQFAVVPASGELRVLGGLVPLNDYQVLGEMPAEAAKRIYSSTGLKVLKEGDLFKTAEPLKDPRQLKLMKQRNKACCPHEAGAQGKAIYEDEDPDGQ